MLVCFRYIACDTIYGMNKKADVTEKVTQAQSAPDIVGEPARGIAKLATGVSFSASERGDIFMAFLSHTNPSRDAILIETIMVDPAHARRIADALNKILEESKDK